ncbi:MAG: uracil-DNA glycosylase family protein, partial [Nitrososphaerales archaeon]
ANCSCYLSEEFKILKNVRVVLTLGSLAFNAYTSMQNVAGLKFKHNVSYQISDKTLVASYHPSRQNTQTGKLTWNAWMDVFRKIRKIIDS